MVEKFLESAKATPFIFLASALIFAHSAWKSFDNSPVLLFKVKNARLTSLFTIRSGRLSMLGFFINVALFNSGHPKAY